MKFEEIVKDIVNPATPEERKTTEQVFSNTKYARKAWAEGDYLGIFPNASSRERHVLAIFRDELWGTGCRNWDTVNEDREADDWFIIGAEEAEFDVSDLVEPTNTPEPEAPVENVEAE